MQYVGKDRDLFNESDQSLASRHLYKDSSQYYAWVTILLCSAFLFYKFILQVSPSVMTSDLMRVFHVSGAGLGNLAATYFYAFLLAQLFAGPLLDQYSPKIITALAISLCGVGAMLFASTDVLLIAELSRALIGIGAAFATVSYMKMTSIWFKPSQMAFADGLLATAAMTGALCGQLPLAYLVKDYGWQKSLIYCGFLGIFLAVLFLLLIKDRPVENSLSVKKLKLNEFVQLLKKRENWLLALYSGLIFSPVAILGGLWGTPFFIETYHLSSTQAASFTSCIFLGLAFGGPIFGLFSDKWGRIRMMKLGTVISFLMITLLIVSTHLPLWFLATVLFIFGFSTGAFMSCFSLGKELNDIKLTATVISLINSGDAFFSSFTEPLIGKILDLNWNGEIVNSVHHFSSGNFRYAFSILPLYAVAALICLLVIDKSWSRHVR